VASQSIPATIGPRRYQSSVSAVPEPHSCIDLDTDETAPKPFVKMPAGPAVLPAGFDEIRKPSFALPVDAGRAS
jgi:hypothetical protein